MEQPARPQHSKTCELDRAKSSTSWSPSPPASADGDNNRSGWTEEYFPFQNRHFAHYGNGEAYFVHVNNIGTAGQVTDYTGAVVQDLLHYPWGQDWLGAMVVENRFAGMRHRDAETSFDPTHFRMYASTEGRWLSPDPVAGCPLHPENFDRYNYAGNNPVNLTDPNGGFLILPPPPPPPWNYLWTSCTYCDPTDSYCVSECSVYFDPPDWPPNYARCGSCLKTCLQNVGTYVNTLTSQCDTLPANEKQICLNEARLALIADMAFCIGGYAACLFISLFGWNIPCWNGP